MPNRCFPPPWATEDIGAAFVVRDHHGQALAYAGAERTRRGGILQVLEPDQCEVVTNTRKLTLSLSRWNHDSG
jgi:hypothetical protein